MASVIALLVTKGIIIDDLRCENSIVYGERLNYKSSSFMDVAKYEFSYADQDEWFDEEPTKVGQYKMRAYSLGNFGIRYTGQIYYFEIKPKPVTFYIENTTFVYGNEIFITGDLNVGDKVSSFDVEYDDEYALLTNASPKDVKVVNDMGEDVTSCYDINYEKKEVNISKRAVVFKSYGAKKEYDGEELRNDDIKLISGSLKDGDTVSYGECVSIKDVSKVLNEREVIIKDKEGVDITNIFYDVVSESEYLEVTKRKIEITSNNLNKIYDGEKFHYTEFNYEVSKGNILTSLQHKLKVNFTNKDLFKVCENEFNEFYYEILDENGNDVSYCYEVSVNFGLINIAKRNISITSKSGGKVYDGEIYYLNDFIYEENELAITDEIIVDTYTSVKEVSETANILTYKINNNLYSDDVTSCYEINPTSGTLLIEKRPIKITIENLTKVYDGTPLIGDKVLYDENDVANNEHLITLNPSSITDVGTIDNDVTIDIIGEDGLSKLHNYEVIYGDRTDRLKITHRPLQIEISSEQKTYDGEELKSTYEIVDGDVALGQRLVLLTQTAITHVDEGPIISEMDFDILDSNDKSVISNYDISIDNGSLQIDKKPLLIYTNNDKKTYNGKTHDVSICYDVEGLVDNDELALNVTCDGIDVGYHKYNVDIENITIKNKEGRNVLDDYSITFINEANLQITQRKITLTLVDKEKIYDGTPLSSNEFEVTSGSIVEGQHAVVTSNDSVTNVADSPVRHKIATSKILEDNTLIDKTHNYAITHRRGSLKILPRPITIKTNDMTTVFDGKVHSENTYKITSGDLANGDVLEVEFPINGITNVWEQRENNASFKVKTSTGEDNTSNYDITVNFGTLTITPCPITVMTKSETHEYDGTKYEYDSSEFIIGRTMMLSFILSGKLPEGYSLKGKVEVSGILAGEYEAKFNVTEVLSDNPETNDIRNFDISHTDSNLIIKQREIVITSLSGTKYYDGTPFPDTKWISSGSLANGDTIKYEEIEPIVNIGTHVNTIKVLGIFNSSGEDVTDSYKIECKEGTINIISSSS